MSGVCLTRGVAEAAAACDDEGWTACLFLSASDSAAIGAGSASPRSPPS
jgi:hypothetical protein